MKQNEILKQSNLEPPQTPLTTIQKFWSFICPCFIRVQTQKIERQKVPSQNSRKQSKYSIFETPSYLFMKQQSNSSELAVQALTLNTRSKNHKLTIFKSLQELSQKFDVEDNIYVSTVKKWQVFPISPLPENQFILLGGQTSRMLASIVTINLKPSSKAKILINKRKSYERRGSFYPIANLDKYWDKRYNLFEKFDEGILINEQAWPCAVPEALSDHLASNIKCEVVLNAFCGVGGDAIKLANTCGRVIATDPKELNLKQISLNCKIYGVQNVEVNFQNIQWIKNVEPNVVVVSLYSNLQQDCLPYESVGLDSLKPRLSLIIKKSLSISKNIVLVLPANIDVNELASAFAEDVIEQQLVLQTCSLKIQKIFYCSQFKYIVVYFGTLVNNLVTINDELTWIYKSLDPQSRKNFEFRKIIKKLRESFGMVRLFNIIIESSKFEQGSSIQKLISYIRKNNLIQEDRIQKIFTQKTISPQKLALQKQVSHMETNVGESDQEQNEQTISYVSSLSGVNKIDFDDKQVQTGPFKSALLFRASQNISSFKSPKMIPFKSALYMSKNNQSKSFKNDEGVTILDPL